MAHDDILRLSYTESLLHLEHGRLATLMDELDAELTRPCARAARPCSASPARHAAPAYIAHTPPTRTRCASLKLVTRCFAVGLPVPDHLGPARSAPVRLQGEAG